MHELCCIINVSSLEIQTITIIRYYTIFGELIIRIQDTDYFNQRNKYQQDKYL